MEIKQTFSDDFFKEKSRILGNCYIIKEKLDTFYYEFLIQDKQAKIITKTKKFLEEITEFHHKTHPYITKYYTTDASFSMQFEEIHQFKLPISILQVSKLFLNQRYLSSLKKYLDPLDISIPVQIIDDEYVVLDRHHELFLALEYGEKMIPVYLDTPKRDIATPLYLAKEQNIRTIQDVKILSNEEYQTITEQLNTLFESI